MAFHDSGTDPVVGPRDDPARPAALAGYLRDAAATGYVFVPFGTGTAAAGGLFVAGGGPREWSGDELAFLDGTAADLTCALDQVRLDEQQEALVNRLRELNRRRTDFINMVSHDLRGPLTSILSYAEDIAEQDERLTDRQRNGLAVIRRNTSRLTGMADELLTLARAESHARPLDAHPIRLADLVAGVVATMQPAADRGGLELRCEVPAEVWVEGDAGQLERALLNLLGNAVKFTPPGGRVTISAAERRTGGVQVAVSDTGIGIPEAELEKLFEPFRRARNATAAAIPGTGLGLATVPSRWSRPRAPVPSSRSRCRPAQPTAGAHRPAVRASGGPAGGTPTRSAAAAPPRRPGWPPARRRCRGSRRR